MKLRFALLSLVVLAACQNPAAPSKPTPNTPAGPRLYAAGAYLNNPTTAKLWVGGETIDVGSGEIYALARKESDLYEAGYSNDEAGYWLNGVWHDLSPAGSDSSYVSAIAIAEDVWMVGGSTKSKVERALIWKNGIASELSALAGKDSYAACVLVDGDDVYVGGYSQDASGTSIPGYWKNGTWNPLPTSAIERRGNVNALVLADGNLYAAGFRASAASADVLQAGYWKNGVWNELPSLSSTQNSIVAGFAVASNGDLYAAGWSAKEGNGQPGYWKNGEWTLLPSQNAQRSSGGTCLLLVGNDVYIGGYNSNEFYQWQAGYWKNGLWTPLSSSSGSNMVNALVWG